MRDDGDAETLPEGATKITAEYRVPYLAHATMEPMNATALYSGIKLEIWSGNQAPLFTRKSCAKAVGLEPEAVEVHTTYMGGGLRSARRAGFLGLRRAGGRRDAGARRCNCAGLAKRT